MDKSVLVLILSAFLMNLVDSSSGYQFEGSAQNNNNYNQEKSVVCYFTHWAWYRDGPAKFRPENINASLCTHIVYNFASLDSATLTITHYDSWAGIENNFYKLVTAYKNSGLKVLISIGGWVKSGGDTWTRLLRNCPAQGGFVRSVVAFLNKYNFDGLEVNYMYPGCPQGNKNVGSVTDAESFNRLLFQLKVAFNRRYLLIAATSSREYHIKECYKMTDLIRHVDLVNIMGYDYHSFYDGVTGANAPLRGTGSSWGVVETLSYYLRDLNCPSNKILLGMPFFGQTFTVANSCSPQFGVPISGPGIAGTYTNSSGTLAYYEICQLIQRGYKSGHCSVNGSYAWNGNQFISYDGPTDIIEKSSLINNLNLNGAAFWTLDYDDFSNLCGCGSYPLLTTINQQLGRLKCANINCY